jgi:four helix bundle protein
VSGLSEYIKNMKDIEDAEEKKRLKTHEDLEIFQLAFEAAMIIFELSKKFPQEEKYALTDQIRRSSRSVCANLAEAWRKRRYKAAFIAKLTDCTSEAAETQVWLKFAVKCQYIEIEIARDLYGTYNHILGGLVKMMTNPDNWIFDQNLLVKETDDCYYQVFPSDN